MAGFLGKPAMAKTYRFVYCSDVHYGLFRHFRGKDGVSSSEVSRAMIAGFKQLPATQLPADGGLGAGEKAGKPEFIICTGDIANRMEYGVQPATLSWQEFCRDWYGEINVPLCLVPGNHDISNAIGYPFPLSPERDATDAVGIYNEAMRPDTLLTAETFCYDRDRVHYVVQLDKLRLVLMGMWPDGLQRRWFEREVAAADSVMPAIIFTHDPPEADAKHFTNPLGSHDINSRDRFENLLSDTCSVTDYLGEPVANWDTLACFFRRHPFIKAYFHGDKNYNEFYDWKGPRQNISLPVFRVDSPMKGEYTAADERKLSFIYIIVDTDRRRLTARECLWNSTAAPGELQWGETRTIDY